jgi:hypothetical protein
MKNGGSIKLTPFCLKFFAGSTITDGEHQTIKLADHTHKHQDEVDRCGRSRCQRQQTFSATNHRQIHRL